MDPQTNQTPNGPGGRVGSTGWQQGLGGQASPMGRPTVSGPMGGGMPVMGMNTPPRRNLPLPLIAVVVVILVVGAITYFAFFAGGSGGGAGGKKSVSADANLSELNSITFNVPNTIKGYKQRGTGSPTMKAFASADGSCEITVGTTTSRELPGADLNAIVKPQIQELKDGGATVKGPDEGDSIVIKNKDTNRTYGLPTVTFEFTRDKTKVIEHYSAVVLKNGDRAIVTRICGSPNGSVDESKVSAVDDLISQITISIND